MAQPPERSREPSFDLIEVHPTLEVAVPPPVESAPAIACEVPPVLETACEPPEPSVPPASNLDVAFFDEPTAETWLAQLEFPDPRAVLKATAAAARRRAHLARYVIGVVGTAGMLGLVAIIKSAVPAGDDDAYSARPAARMMMPGSEQGSEGEPVALPATLAAPAPSPEPSPPASPEAHDLRDAGPG